MVMQIPNELIEQIYRGNTVLFVGAGLSVGAGLPTWSQLMHYMIAWAEDRGVDLSGDKPELMQLIKQGRYLVVAEELRERMGDQRFRTLMQTVFRDDTKVPSPVHTVLPEIPFAAVLTTNYDVLLESAYTWFTGVRPRTYTQADTPELADLHKSKEFYILKVHGDIDRIETVVLGRSDYRQAMFANEAYRDFLTTLFLSRTVFFVGFSLTDPDLLLLLDELGTAFKGYGGFHYALLSTKEAGSIQRRRWERDYGIHIISYKASKGHPEVHALLSVISERVAERIVFDALKTVWRGLPHNHFVVEGPNARARRLFVERLVDTIQKEPRDYSFCVVQLDMEGVSEQMFLPELGARLCQMVKTRYPSIEVVWDEGDALTDSLSVWRCRI